MNFGSVFVLGEIYASAMGFYLSDSGIDMSNLFLEFQVARAILENPHDTTKVHLIYANVTVDDILLKVMYIVPPT